MRDPTRIQPLLRMIGWLWSEDPDLRLGQLLVGLLNNTTLFYAEDDDLAASLCAALAEKSINGGEAGYPFPKSDKWWLISEEDAKLIRLGLERIEDASSARSFIGKVTGDILHALDSGLHTTEAVPEDFKDE